MILHTVFLRYFIITFNIRFFSLDLLLYCRQTHTMINHIWRWFILFYLLTAVSPISAGFWGKILYYTVSHFSEQCDKRWVTQDIVGLTMDLSSHVFGQEMVSDVVVAALQSHLTKSHRKKPLVFNFHGWPGGGKGYVADFILKNWFKKGGKSKFVKKYVSKLSFPLKTHVREYQVTLQRELEETVSRCPKAMFIFDEVDKYPEQVLDGIKPYLDYSTNVNGLDFRETIFIFITNNGEQLINNIVLQKWHEGIPREKLKLSHFENALKTTSFNDEGGFYRSDLIKHHLIDVVVPFLPLEREHVKKCIEAEIYLQKGSGILNVSEVTSEIIEEMVFGPPGVDLYSTSGCKHVNEKVGTIIEREKKKRRFKYEDL